MAGERARNCTAYVSLEPCNHVGRQPPCTHALLRHGVRRVVVGVVDPDPRVSGGGIGFLRERGIDVSVGVERQLCLDTNAAFIHRILQQRPLSVVAIGVQDAESEEPTGILADFETVSDWGIDPTKWMLSMREGAPDADTVILDTRWSEALTAYLETAADSLFPQHVTVITVQDETVDWSELSHRLTAVRSRREVHSPPLQSLS